MSRWSGFGLPWTDTLASLARPKDDIEILKSSVLFCLGTIRGERVMNPKFGTVLANLIFDPADSMTGARIESTIRESLAQWEPRVDVVSFTYEVRGDVVTGVLQFRPANLLDAAIEKVTFDLPASIMMS